MAEIFWNTTSNGNWTDAADWTSGTVPGAGDDAVLGVTNFAIVQNYTVSANTTIKVNSLTFTNGGAVLAIASPGAVTVATNVDIDPGVLDVDSSATLTVSGNLVTSPSDGYAAIFSVDDATATIDGTLTNSGTTNIGDSNLSAPTTVTAGGLNNTSGTINVTGNSTSGSTDKATLHIASAAPSAWAGALNVSGDAVVEFSSGSITSITSGSEITLGSDGPNAVRPSYIADASNTAANGALTGLASIEGTLSLQDSTPVTLAGNVTNTGAIDVDTRHYPDNNNTGGSQLTVAGTLTNAGAVDIGNYGLIVPETVALGGLVNSGTINLAGNWTSGTTEQETLKVGGAAPSVWTGAINLSGDALLQFTSGQITRIASGSEITLGGGSPGTGAQSRIADAGATGSSSALLGLTTNSGGFSMRDDAVVTLSGSFTNTSGAGLFVDNSAEYGVGADGGSVLTISGSLTNAAQQAAGTGVYIGNSDLSSPTIVKVGGVLDNTGTIDVDGNFASGTTEQATLNVAGAAPSVVSGALNLGGDALVEFGSGSITSIASGGEITLGGGSPGTGVQTRIADSGGTGSSGALAGLTTNSGGFSMRDGAVVTLSGSFTNTSGAGLFIDNSAEYGVGADGGSVLTISGSLTNAAPQAADTGVYIGNSDLTSPTTVKVDGSLDNTSTGTIDLTGSFASGTTDQATLQVAGAAPTAWNGSLNIAGDAVLEFGSGSITSITSGSEITMGSGQPGAGVQTFIADASDPTDNGALSGLNSNDGTLGLDDGVVLNLSGNFTNSGSLGVDNQYFPYPNNTGGSKLTISGTWINPGSATIGIGGLVAPTTVTAGGLDDTGGTINVFGNFSSGTTDQATLDVLSAAPANWGGTLNVIGDALVEFTSGSIVNITSGGAISLGGGSTTGGVGYGLHDFIADASNKTSNGALSGLASNAGLLRLEDGVTLALSGSFANGGTLLVDDQNGYWYESGDSKLTISGTFTNSGTADIGNSDLIAPTEVSAGALVNASSGTINLAGNTTSGTTDQATLDISGAAPSTWTGTLNETGDALLEFGSGSITSIASSGAISLGGLATAGGPDDGLQSFIADASDPTANGELKGLTSNDGTFRLEDGVDVALSGSFTNSGTLLIDDEDGYWYNSGDSKLSISGTFTNSGTADIGNSNLVAPTEVSAGALVNTSSGTITLQGNIASGTTDQATLDISGAAPSTWTGTLNETGDALLEFGSGSITTIASTGAISLGGLATAGGPGKGLQSFIADASDPTANGALSGLTNNKGLLRLEDGVVVALSGSFANSGTLLIDDENGYWYNSGESRFTVSGTFNNSGSATLGNDASVAPTIISAGALVNASGGTLDVYGGPGETTMLNVDGAASNSGTLTVGANAEMGVEGAFTDAGTLRLGGTLDLADPLTLTGSGSLVMQGGMVIDPTSGSITVSPGTTLSGNGIIDVPVVNDGTITASAGLLDITGAITGSGAFVISTGSELEIGSTISGGSFSFNDQVGTLKLDHPASFADSIGGVVVGNTIDLVGVQATGATVSGSTLTVTTTSGTLHYQVSGPGLNGTNIFSVQSDQNGGTDITLGTPGPAISGPTRQTAFLDWPSLLGPFTISDTNPGAGTLTVTITAQKGTLTGVDTAGNPLPGNGTNTLTLTGDLADINTMLAGVIYGGATAGTTDNVSISVKDASNLTAAQTVAVTTSTVPYTPIILNGPTTVILVPGLNTAVGGLSLNDPAAQTVGQPLALNVSGPGTIFAINGPGGPTIVGQNSSNIAISGSVVQINADFSDAITAKQALAAAIVAGYAFMQITVSLLLPIVVGWPEGEPYYNANGQIETTQELLLDVLAELPGETNHALEQVNGAIEAQEAIEDASQSSFAQTAAFSIGDAHLSAFGGLSYDFNYVGEFILTQSQLPGDSFEVQARLQPWQNSQSASVITQIAAGIGTDRITIGIGRADPVWIDGVATSMLAGETINLAGGAIQQVTADSYAIQWNTGEVLTVTDNTSYLDVSVGLAAEDTAGSLEGLMGPASGQANVFTLPSGTVLAQPLTSTELTEFADAWRVTQASSLFDYGSGESTATFTDLDFPEDTISLADMPASVLAQAAKVVAALGITSPAAVAAAEYDYIATGNPQFALSSTNSLGLFNASELTVTSNGVSSPTLGVIAEQASIEQSSAGETAVTFQVYLTAAEDTGTTIDYSVVDPDAGDISASALGGTLPSGSITIAANQTTAQFTIDLPANVLGSTPSENLAVQITSPSAVPIFAPTAQTNIFQPEAGPAPLPELEYLGGFGNLTHDGNTYTLDLGLVELGEALPLLQFGILNGATQPSADDLAGTITWSNVAGYSVEVNGSTSAPVSLPAPIAPGDSYNDIAVMASTGLDPSEVVKFGAQSETITFNPIDTNSSGYSSPLSPLTLIIADTLQVPGTMYSQAWGDVHIVTYSGVTYDFQAAGEFILAQSQTPGDSFDIQLRLQPYSTSSTVTFITQAAISLGSDDVTFDTGGGREGITVRDDGQLTTLSMADPTLTLSGGTITEVSPSMYQVTWNTGETMTVTAAQDLAVGGIYYLNVSDSAPDVPGSVVGLQTGDDLPSTTCDLYGEYADEWRVTAADSLFYYTAGETTATFTVPGFPSDQISLADVPASVLAKAAAVVAAAGITDPNLVQEAELDYLATGTLEAATAGANVNQQVTDTTSATITPCTAPTTAIGVVANAATVTEATSGTTAVTFTAYLTGSATSATTIDYAVTSGGSGFFTSSQLGGTFPSGSVTVSAGQTTAQFTIDVPQGGLGTNPAEDLEVQVSSPGGALPVFAPTAQTEVDNYQAEAGTAAQPVLAYLGNVGTFSFNSATDTYTLDLGGVVEGAGLVAAEFAVVNAADAPADNLSGTFTPPTGEGFIVTGDNLASPLAAGEAYEGLYTSIDTFDLGTNNMSLTFDPTDVNGSGYTKTLTPLKLVITDSVVAAAVAQTNTPTTIIFPNAHVGATESQHVSITNTTTSGGAGLDVTLTPSGNAITSGTITQLAPGNTNAASLSVGIDTSSAGALAGSVTENFASDAGGGVTNPIGVEDPYIDLFGDVYRLADPALQPNNLTVHVGVSGSQTLTITNADPNDGYSENLIATVVGVTGAVQASGSTGEISAGSVASLPVSFSTASAGLIGTVTLDMVSDGGTGSGSIDGLGKTDLGMVTIPVSVTAGNVPAAAAFVELSSGGTLTHSGSLYTLNFGTISTLSTIELGVENDAGAPADTLAGGFTVSGPVEFTNSGFSAFSGLAAGAIDSGLTVSLTGAVSGSFSETITLDPTDQNGASNPALAPETLTVTGTVIPCYSAPDPTLNSNSYVSSGVVVSGATVSGGTNLNVLGGAKTSAMTVSADGLEMIYGSSVATTITAGGADYVESGGIGLGTDLTMCTNEFVQASGYASGTLVESAAQEFVFGLTSGAVVSNGGLQDVETGSAVATSVAAGGEQYVGSAGTALGTQVAPGGGEVMFGLDSGATIRGTQYDFAIASGGTTDSGGLQLVQIGGTAFDMNVVSGGIQYVGSGGVTSAVRLASGGAEIIFGSDGGGAVLSGTQYVFGTASGGMLYAAGFEQVQSGGTALGLTVQSGAVQYIGSGGLASGTQVDKGGAEVIFGDDDAAAVSGTQYVFARESGGTLYGGAFEQVVSGAMVLDVTVEAAAQQFVGSSAVASGTQLASGGAEVIFGADSGAAISGTQYVFGSARGATVSNGGYQEVESGGTAAGTVVDGGGVAKIAAGGTAIGFLIQSRGAEVVVGTDSGAVISGTQYVDGLASGTTVAGGGYQLVSAGGTLSAPTIDAGGVLEFSSGAHDGNAPITFSGGGALILDASTLFSGTIAGFSDNERIDFADIAYVASGATATTANWTPLTSGANASGTLVVSQGGHFADITLLGQYVAGNFALSSDGHGGTLLTDPPALVATDPTPLALTTARPLTA